MNSFFRLYITLSIFIFTCFFLTFHLNAQWVKSSGPVGGSVNAMAVNGNTLYAGTYGGVFKSTDNGVSWTAVNTGLANPWVNALALNGNNLFVGHGYSGVSLSTN